MTNALWTPSMPQQSGMHHFMQMLPEQFINYDALYQWSVNEPEQFWQAIVDYFDIDLQGQYQRVVNDYQHMLEAKWFEGAKLNFAHHFLRQQSDKTAIIAFDENNTKRVLTFKQLNSQVMQLINHFKQLGVKAGDRVAAIMPNTAETIIAMLATAALGAIWSSCSPDFGYQGIMDRFEQITPRVLIASDGHFYNGKKHSGIDKIAQISQSISSIEHTIIVPYIESIPNIEALDKTVLWHDCLIDESPVELDTYPFDHPLYILFSSGTTGKPKCIVHGAGGTLLQHLKELGLHADLKHTDNLFFYTTCGWMMWNWMVSALALGSTITLFDGSPTYPTPARLFDIIAAEDVSVFGTSAKFISAIEKLDYRPAQHHDFSHLKTLLSTGSPLLPKNYDFINQAISETIQISSISGGTDILSCFALGNPLTPVYRGELQCLGLGMKVNVFDEQGISIKQQKGELVCTQAFPSMPVYFWQDPDNSKYFNAYFNRFEKIWAHGDFAEITKNDGLIIYGRSDAILNPGGVRIGTAEIYRQVEKIHQVVDSVVIGQHYQDDVRVILFVKLQQGISLDAPLIKLIQTTIRQNATPRHVPAIVLAVSDIPRTRSGKIVELAIRDTVEGREVKNIGSLANPEALQQFSNRMELQ